MSELISHTPKWVFAVFFTLLVLGFIQSKERVVKVKTIFILPIAMIIFSFFGVYSVFGLSYLTMSLWIMGLVTTLFIGLKLAYPNLIIFSGQSNKLTIPGSWVPLFLMMAIFFTKYFVGFAVARGLPVVSEHIFVVLLCLLYGAFSGIFLSRSFVMFKASKASAKKCITSC
ncbi:DUF6622 family protein [Colwellia hornerae]|uniref:DUF1453 domain-containing protein n=1 Tax=Colwellia hornerae TaxID=89402 RepID=A0A5C6Q2H6_9GAMM|nr:DUF6622 family protein [Colwellia hornerae]TWX45093.1 hypothetical protein ESZ28_18790 [Colwellia hornerae]TWX53304.1 hypothetical protein ESZ26_18840 [Colwellia hornerae]TWX62236.1 hypothetical protein ESZ27_18865 [Colwellia hornerae]